MKPEACLRRHANMVTPDLPQQHSAFRVTRPGNTHVHTVTSMHRPTRGVITETSSVVVDHFDRFSWCREDPANQKRNDNKSTNFHCPISVLRRRRLWRIAAQFASSNRRRFEKLVVSIHRNCKRDKSDFVEV